MLCAGGARVAIVERELLGGTSTYWGCTPSKTLLRPGEVLAAARQVPGAAEALNGSALDATAALRWRDFMVSGYDDRRQESWAHRIGVEVLRGQGRLAGAHTVDVDGSAYRAEHVVIATGSDPAIPAVPGLRDLPGIWTERQATELTDVPERVVVFGAGPIGVEMSQALARMGASVVLADVAQHVLPCEPRPVGEAIGAALSDDGVDLRLVREVVRARMDGEDYVLELADNSHARGNRLLVATGRRPRVHDIGLESVNVRADPRGIRVDGRMSFGEKLWAIGDVTGLWPFTHVGEYQGRVAASNILGHSRAANYEAVPRVVFTDPQAASVGQRAGPCAATVPLSSLARTSTYTRAYETRPGFLTLVSDGVRLIGAYAVGPQAGEWLQQATLAIRARTRISVLLDVMQPFPTFSEALFQALSDLDAQIRRSTPPSPRPV
ncbi:NAD(P)/FAD-dependent oxidoreductase [Intrasporangium mesophilum]